MSKQDGRVIRLRPYNYIHILDNNTNIAHIEVGPKTFVRKDHEQLILKPTAMINIPPRSYCIVANPVQRDKEGEAILLADGQARLRHGELEVRVFDKWTTPFPLYPGEVLSTAVTNLLVVKPNTALKCRATRDFEEKGVNHDAGDEWLFKGPGTYIPQIEVEVVQTIVAQVIKPNQALKLRATRQFTDRNEIERQVGEEWLVKDQGSFLPSVYEQVVGRLSARVLTEKRALHLKAEHTFTDAYGKKRRAGNEWLVTHLQAQTHLQDVNETVVNDNVSIITLTKQQYCVVVNPVDKNGDPQWGQRDLRKGEVSFFLQPGEELENGVETVQILGEDEALLLRASDEFTQEASDGEARVYVAGEEWMIFGPRKYVPPVEVTILERRHRIPLDENEGIYVRNKSTGKVFVIRGQTYMLKTDEELWEKEIPASVEALLQSEGYRGLGQERRRKAGSRERHKMIVYRVPHNAAVQVYDYKMNVSRVVFGPELVMLQPEEQFSVISLSGGIPKQPNQITSLSLMLGPDFMNDVVVVETSDHARLKLKLSYNWHFGVDKTDQKQADQLFSVRDFIGDTCKAIASNVRGAVAMHTFDYFHKHSADIIRESVFGKREGDDKTPQKMVFSANRLTVTNIDIQSVAPVEQRTRDALQKSVQLAIEIATASQEAIANHEAAREEQVAEGALHQQRIRDQADAEAQRMDLVKLRAKTAAVESTGQAKAEAIARSEAALIKGQAALKHAGLKAQAATIRHQARLSQLRDQQKQELEYIKALNDLEVEKTRADAQTEAQKFADIVEAIGAETIEAIAIAGPEMQAKLLEGLGLQGFLVTDGTSPVNLFNTANGLVSNTGH
jgi:major vault protein